jgi:hypothetical protein
MNLSAPEGRGGFRSPDNIEKHTKRKADGSLAGAIVLNKAVTGLEGSHNYRPAKKQRRTISI